MTNREKFLRERRRADDLELKLIQLHQRSSEANLQLGELASQNERLKEACEPLVGFRRQLAEANLGLNVANDRIGALTSLVERLTFVADQNTAAQILGETSLVEVPGSMLAVDPVRWAELIDVKGEIYRQWKADREAASE